MLQDILTMLQDVLIVTGLLFVRVGLPLIALLALGYLLDRWLGYAEEDRVTGRRAEPTEVEVGMPAGQAVPAWTLMPCASRVRRAYSMLDRPALPCWLALELAEGRLWEQCPACRWYRPQVEERAELRVAKGGRGA